mgnify:CR=1 FL=1
MSEAANRPGRLGVGVIGAGKVGAVLGAALRNAEINLAYTKVAAPISGRIGRSMMTEGALVTADQTTALTSITQLDLGTASTPPQP